MLRDKLFPVEPGTYIPEQTPEWGAARLGRITASERISIVLRWNPASLNALLDDLEYELREGEPKKKFTGNWCTRHGNTFEDRALSEYDMARLSKGLLIRKPGFTVHPECSILGATPDFFVGDDTVGQVKCPAKVHNHVALLYGGPGRYMDQIQCESLVSNRPHIVFVTFSPNMPAVQQLGVHLIDASKAVQTAMLERCLELEHKLFKGCRFTVGRLSVEGGVPLLF